MRTSIAAFASLLIVVHWVMAQPAPEGPPPTFKVVDKTEKDKGLIYCRVTATRLVSEVRERVVNVNGVPVTERVTVSVPVYTQTFESHDAKQSRVITPDGKQLPIDEVWTRLKKNTVVVFSTDGNTPAPAYLRALSAETLVIIPGPMKK